MNGAEEQCQKVHLNQDEFGGLIGNFVAGGQHPLGSGSAPLNGMPHGSGGGGGGGIGIGWNVDLLMGQSPGPGAYQPCVQNPAVGGYYTPDNAIGCGGQRDGHPFDGTFNHIGAAPCESGSKGLVQGGLNALAGALGDLVVGKAGGGGSAGKKRSNGQHQKPIGRIIDALISSTGGVGNRGKYGGGGAQVHDRHLGGAVLCDKIGHYIAKAAHRYLGNLLFNLGGKDNGLGQVGKVVLDNIVSGKFRRDVDPYVKPEPILTPGEPIRRKKPTIFIQERDRCLRERRLYEDPEFPASDASLYFSRRPPVPVVWLRPGQIVADPQLIAEGQSRFDVIQGQLGDCWLMAATANLTMRSELFYRVLPPDQSFTENYAGIFHFQFWQYGRWTDVVIDDRLPCSRDGTLLYLHSRQLNEFWSALLEKAYAKLYGSYEALKGGTTGEALADLTGGLVEFYDLREPPRNLYQMMARGFEMGSLFGCSIEADPRVFEAKLRNGLIRGHAYSITGMRIVPTRRGQVPLLRIRNPWGDEREWNGAWSDNSEEWRQIPAELKRDMDLTFAHDGEFWMCFDDFMRCFEKMEICNLGPEVADEVFRMTGVRTANSAWATHAHDASWRRGRSAGGCRNYLRTFAANPQFWMRLTDADPFDDDRLCTVIITVMQKYRRELKHIGLENLAIGFAVYEASGMHARRLDTHFFANTASCARSAAFINLREVSGRFRFPPGEYVIVPSTYEPDEEADFMLRIFTNSLIESRQI